MSSKLGNFIGDCRNKKGDRKGYQLLSLSHCGIVLHALDFWIITWDLHSSEDYQSLYGAEFGFQFDLGNLYRLHRRKADTVYHASQHFYFQIQCSVLISTLFNWVKFFVFSPIKLS